MFINSKKHLKRQIDCVPSQPLLASVAQHLLSGTSSHVREGEVFLWIVKCEVYIKSLLIDSLPTLQVCRQLYEVMTKLAEQHSDKMFTIQGAPRSVFTTRVILSMYSFRIGTVRINEHCM